MKLHRLLALAALPIAAAATFAATSAMGANAILNGGFETSSATSPFVANWLINGVAGGTTNTYVRDTTAPHGGSADEQFTGSSQGGGANAALFQITAPGSVSGNTAYTLDFWAKVANVGPSGVQFYQILYFDAANGIVGNTGSQNVTGNANTYTHNIVNVTTPANTDHIQLEFDAIVGAIDGASSTIILDDVSFANVPEPTSLGALAVVAGGLVARRRRR